MNHIPNNRAEVMRRYPNPKRRTSDTDAVSGMNRAAFVFLILAGFLCVLRAVAAEQSHRLPSATEVFQLRSLCAKLGEQLLDETTVGTALTKDQVSHYDPKSNRCYVELTVQKISPKGANDYVNRNIYD